MEVLASRAAETALPGGAWRHVVLVGQHPAYAHLGLPVVADAVAGLGPIGGLLGLLQHAAAVGASHGVTLACDQPFVGRALLERLLAEHPDAALLAPRRDAWELLCARWHVARALPVVAEAAAAGRGRLQALATALEAVALADVAPHQLHDWDSSEDVGRV